MEGKVTMTDRRISFGFAGWLDDQMAVGTTWAELEQRAKKEAARRGRDPILATRPRLVAHAQWRRDHNKWRVAHDNQRVSLTMPFVKTWSNY